MPLSDLQKRLIAYSEMMWFQYNRLPTPDELCSQFNLSAKALNKILADEDVVKSFEGRGMPVVQGRDLTPKQVTAINTILNLADQRSRRKKLQDMGISETIWNGWQQNPSFAMYFADRAEKILGDSIPEAHLALVDNVMHGDISSIKLLYEITGRFKSGESGADPRVIINKVFEIIAKHIQDSDVLDAIANDLALLVALDRPSSITPVAAPQVVRGEIGI